MNAARVRIRRPARRASRRVCASTSSAVYSGSTSRAELVKRDVAQLALLVAPAPLGDFGAQALELRRARRAVGCSAEVSRRGHRLRSASEGLRCARAARRRRRTDSSRPLSSAASCSSSHSFVAASRPEPAPHLALQRRRRPARATGRAAACRSVAARLKIAEVPVERGDDLGDALALRRDRAQHRRRPPRSLVPSAASRAARPGFIASCSSRRHRAAEIDAMVRRHVLERVAVAQAEHQLELVAQTGRRPDGRPCSRRRCRRSPSARP